MIIYVDYKNNRIFILAPKCGNNTLANYLNVPLHVEYPNIIDMLNNNKFTKIIVLHKHSILTILKLTIFQK